MYLTLEQVKQHLLVDSTFTDDDAYIESLIYVAEDVLSRVIDNELVNLIDENEKLPKALEHAMLLLIGDYYKNRENTTALTVNKIPFAFDYLADLYHNYNNKPNRYSV